MSIRDLNKLDWDDLSDTVHREYHKLYQYSYGIPEEINFIGKKTIIHGRASTFGFHGRTYDTLKKMFSTHFLDLPRALSNPPLDINEDLWKILYIWRLQRGV